MLTTVLSVKGLICKFQKKEYIKNTCSKQNSASYVYMNIYTCIENKQRQNNNVNYAEMEYINAII